MQIKATVNLISKQGPAIGLLICWGQELHAGRSSGGLTAVCGGATAGEHEACKGVATLAKLAAATPNPKQDHGTLCMYIQAELCLYKCSQHKLCNKGVVAQCSLINSKQSVL